MTEHVTAWLGAYHDGELRGRQARQLESHLARCAACRSELERLRALTALLRESPTAVDLTPPERFVAQVGLRLPRRPERPAWRSAMEIGWQLAPFGLLGAWAFVQAVFTVAGMLLLALGMGLGGDVVDWLPPVAPPGPSPAEMFSRPGADLNDIGQVVLYLLRDGGPLGWSVILNLVSLVVIGLLYWSWLASWWVRRKKGES